MLHNLLRDRVLIRIQDGAEFDQVPASVQKGRIFVDRVDIPIRPGDTVVRRLPSGVEETFIVEDPGYHEGLGGIPATYQMHVRRADAPVAPETIPVVYNISGPNARFNINSTDSSTNIVTRNPDQLFSELRKLIEKEVEDAPQCSAMLEASEKLQSTAGKPGFLSAYRDFISIAADHIGVLAPFLPALTQLLPT